LVSLGVLGGRVGVSEKGSHFIGGAVFVHGVGVALGFLFAEGVSVALLAHGRCVSMGRVSIFDGDSLQK